MARSKRQEKFTRVQLEFSGRTVKQVDDLVRITDSPSRAEVIRHAVQLYAIIAEGVIAGGRIVVRKADGTEVELLFPELECLRFAQTAQRMEPYTLAEGNQATGRMPM